MYHEQDVHHFHYLVLNHYTMAHSHQNRPMDVGSITERFNTFTSKWNRPCLQSEHIASIELLSHGDKSDLIVELLECELDPSDDAIDKVRVQLGRRFAGASLSEIYMELAESIGDNENVIVGRSEMVTEIVEQLKRYGQGGCQCNDGSEIEDVCPATLDFLHVLVIEIGWNITSLGELEGCINLGDDMFCLVHPDEVSSLGDMNALLRESETGLELGPHMPLSIINPKYTLHWRDWVATPYPLEENVLRGDKKWDKNYPIDFSHMSTRNIEYLNVLYSRLDMDFEIIQHFMNENQILTAEVEVLRKQVGSMLKRISGKRKRG